MTTKATKTTRRGNPPPLIQDEQPLLRVLVAEATRRGDTLAKLARQLGVTYERLAQWRRGESAVINARRPVFEKAAQYLGIPTVLVLAMTGILGLDAFVWPNKGSLGERVSRELERLSQDPFLGPFVPHELASAAPAVKFFVVFLFHELNGGTGREKSAYRWLTALHQAAAGNVQAQVEIEKLRKQATQNQDLF